MKFLFEKEKLFIFLIVIFALFLRVWKVAEYPAGLNADEAAIGYNAYSLIQTGKDEFGHSWPINFQSFNDFKPGLYFYLALPFVKLLGLNELAVRLPSAILGTLTVYLVYLLVKNLFQNRGFGLMAAFLLAISPWHLHFSRGGWESNVAVFFIVLGVYLFYLGLQKPKYFVFCALSFILSMYTYHSARVITPLLLTGLTFFYRKDIFVKKNRKSLVITFLIACIILVPLIKAFIEGAGTSRFSGVGIFADQGPFWRVNELRGQHLNPFAVLPTILHNRYFEYAVLFFDNLLRHFSGDFLFISGDEIQRNRIPEMGQMYLAELPFFIFGLYFLIKNKPKNWQFLLYWLIIAPTASALTFQSPHAIRSLNMVVPLIIICAYGLWNFWGWCKQKNRMTVILLSCYLVILFPWNFAFYMHQYYVHYPKIYPFAWEYGFKDLVAYVKPKENKFKKIYVTNRYDQPYILFAFYLKYPPRNFQKQAKLSPRDQFGFSTVENFDKYFFGPIKFDKIERENSMIIGTPEEIPDSATIVKRIYFKDGKTEAFRIVEN